MTLSSDIQKLTPGAMVDLFELDATSIGGAVVRFHAGVNGLGNDVVWQGNTYTRFPIEAEGFEWNGKGALPRPKLRVANITGLIGALARELDDLVGAKVTRRRTFVKYLDAVNFAQYNRLLWSEEFDQSAYWLRNNIQAFGSGSVANAAAAPDGTMTADFISENTATAVHDIRQNVTLALDGRFYTLCVHAAPATRSKLQIILINGGPGWAFANFDLVSGAILAIGAGGTYPMLSPTASIEAIGDGWFLCSVTASPNPLAINPCSAYFRLLNDAGIISYSGDGSSGLYLWGAQVNDGEIATYQKSTSSWNPTADPNAHFTDEVYFVERKAAENSVFLEFELAAAFDVQGVMLPRRQVVQNVCTWRYRGAECGYAGGAVANRNDQATTVLADDACGKRLASCKLRFGEYGELPYGGFPAVGLLR